MRQGHGGHDGLRQRLQHQATAQLFHGHHGIHKTQAHAVVFGGHQQGGQTQLGQFAVGSAVEATSGGDGAATLEGVALVHPAGDGIAQLLLVVGKIKVHVVSPAVGLLWRSDAVHVQRSSGWNPRLEGARGSSRVAHRADPVGRQPNRVCATMLRCTSLLPP